MIGAGADINHRNRYGCTAAHDLVTIYRYDSATIQRSYDALSFFLTHEGDPDIEEGDGLSAAYMVRRLKPLAPALGAVLAEHKERKQEAAPNQNGQKEGKVPSRGSPCPCGSGRKFKKCCGKDETPM